MAAPFAHLTGRGDFVDMQVIELAPGGGTAPQQHLFESVVYVLAGRGSTSVESPSEFDLKGLRGVWKIVARISSVVGPDSTTTPPARSPTCPGSAWA